MPELTIFRMVASVLLDRLRAARRDERGMTTETVIITAVLATLALAVTAIIVTKMTAEANNIPTSSDP